MEAVIVEGDIFHRSLSIDEGEVFEGSSRRVDNPTDAPASIPEEIPHAQSPKSFGEAEAVTIEAEPPAA